MVDYKWTLVIGLASTILYFDLVNQTGSQIMQFSDKYIFRKTQEFVLIKRFEQMLSSENMVPNNFFIGFNGDIDVILNGKQIYSNIVWIVKIYYKVCITIYILNFSLHYLIS